MTTTQRDDRPARRVEELWGTAIGVDVHDAIDPGCIDDVFGWFRRVDDLFSTWRDDSEISRLGRGELTLAETSPEISTVLEMCQEVREESDGAFDIAVGAQAPPRAGRAAIDPSGLVKGWAVERAGELLAAAGADRYCINAGGDLIARGHPDDAPEWRIGIQHPWERAKLAAVVAVRDLAVATSGCYERGHHVLDPRTGLPARGLTSVTIIGPDLARADAYATAAIALGTAGMSWLSTRTGFDAMGITDEGTVVLTPGFDRHRVDPEAE